MEVTHSIENSTLSHYLIKHLEGLAERCFIDEKQNRMLFWNGEYVNILQNKLQHTDTSNTNLVTPKTKYQSTASILFLYQFILQLFSNNLFWWQHALTNLDFLLSKSVSLNDLII